MPLFQKCQCGLLDRWVADPRAPVEFDKRMNEYHLVKDEMLIMMRYCFGCGCLLPKSKRAPFFTTPNHMETREVRKLLADAHSAADVFRILGSPDETLDWDEDWDKPLDNL